MANLEYRIGGLNIKGYSLKYTGSLPYEAGHLFVVEAKDNIASIYVSTVITRHKQVVERFKLDNSKIVGGGSLYVDRHNHLVLGDYSADYKAISKPVAQKFVNLLLPELRKIGVKPTGVIASPDESKLNPFWNREKDSRGGCERYSCERYS